MVNSTLFELVAIFGLRPTRETFDPTLKTKTKPNFTFSYASYSAFIKDHHAFTDNISYIAFLRLWLSHFFSSDSLQIAKKFIPLATRLQEKRNICLSKLILGNLYESFGTAYRNLKAREYHEDTFLVSCSSGFCSFGLMPLSNPSSLLMSHPI